MDHPGELASARRVAHRLGIMDLMGHISVRLPDERGYLFTPGYDTADITSLSEADLVHLPVVDTAGAAPPSLPREYRADLAIYRSRPEVNAVLHSSSPYAIVLGLTGHAVKALTHTNAELAYEQPAYLRTSRMITSDDLADDLARSLGQARLCHRPGIGLVVTGRDAFDALRVADVYENLAELTALADQLPGACRTVQPQEHQNLISERPVEAVPSRDPRRYYSAVDSLPAVGGSIVSTPGDMQYGALRAAVATTCRVLHAQGNLVAFFEHVTARISHDDTRFLMSPAKHFGLMDAADVGVVSTDGDCAPIDGPYPPAPFRWFHRDVLAARTDIQAIVHTHEVYGRIFAIKGLAPVGGYRNGTGSADMRPPVFPVPSLIFTPANRRSAIELLANHDVLHTITHGTDYLAPTLEEAAVRAIHHEQLCRVEYRARHLGSVEPLGRAFAVDLREHGPTYRQWYAYYCATR